MSNLTGNPMPAPGPRSSSRRPARIRRAGAVLLVAFALQGCEAKLAEFFAPVDGGLDLPTTGSISGTVTSSGVPLEDVRVDVSGVTSTFTFTDATGTYMVDLLDPGPYTLTFSEFPGDVVCSETMFPAEVIAGGTAVVDLGCTDTGGIQGTVTLNGDPWEGVGVVLVNNTTMESVPNAVTDEFGQYSFEDLPVGSYTAGVFHLLPAVTCLPADEIVDVEQAQVAQADFVCTSPPSADEVAGNTDVNLVWVSSTCAGDVLDPFTAPATFTTMDDGSTVAMTVDFPDNPAPNVGTYDPATGEYNGFTDWVEAFPGVEVTETIMLTFTFDALWNVNYAGTSVVDFRDALSQAVICGREFNLDGMM